MDASTSLSADVAQRALKVARDLALQAGQRMLEARADGRLDIQFKGRVDLVTQMDTAIQVFLIEGLTEAFPDHHIVAEEGVMAAPPEPGQPAWFLDPIDGTTNYVHDYPFYATSLGLCVDGIPQVGVVFAPALDELFLARRGEGATVEAPRQGLAPKPLKVRNPVPLNEALCATGFPYHRDQRARLSLALVSRLLHEARGVRRAGAAALDLCHVAQGRLDAYLELNLSPWDLAAGALVVREAGGRVSDWQGDDGWLWGRRILAAGQALHPELLDVLARVHAEPEAWPVGEVFSGALPLDRIPGERFPWEPEA